MHKGSELGPMQLTYRERCRASWLQHTQECILQMWIVGWLAAFHTQSKLASVVALLTDTVSAPAGSMQQQNIHVTQLKKVPSS